MPTQKRLRLDKKKRLFPGPNHSGEKLHASTLERKKRSRGRGRTYGLAVEQVMLVVWESLDYVCAERLTPVLLTTAQHLARFGSVQLTVEIQEQLAQISEATVTRLMRKYRSHKQRLPQKGPERANQVRKPVPMKRIPWETSEPGHFEVDLVHHCGESTNGTYAHTLQMIDVARVDGANEWSSWVEGRWRWKAVSATSCSAYRLR